MAQRDPGAAPGRRILKYEILSILGEGAMGVVYRARDTELGRDVALKVLRGSELADRRLAERFQREAQNAAKLKHPNIITVYEAGRDGDLLFLAAEFVPGLPLSEWRTRTSAPLPTVLGVLEQVARAVHYAHENGIIHRDLKPANILVDDRGQARLVDFGLSRDLDSDHAITQTGAAVGTPFYMSPEQVRGDHRRIDPRSDVYALGVNLYEVLTGRPPSTGKTIVQVYESIQHDDPPPPRAIDHRVPRDLETIAMRALEKEPHRRYASAKAFADDLGAYLRGEPILARPSTIVYRVARRLGRHRAVAALSLVVVAIAAVAVVMFVQAQTDARLRSRLSVEMEDIHRWDQYAYKPGTVMPQVTPELRESVRRLDAIVAAHPGHAPAHYARGKALRRLRELREAYRDLSRAIELAPDDSPCRFERAMLAFDAFNEVAGSVELRDPLALHLGTDWNELLQRLRGDLAVARSGGRLRAWEVDYCGAMLLFVDAREEEAIRDLTGALENARNEPDLYFLRSVARCRFGGRGSAARREHPAYYEQFRLATEDALKALDIRKSWYEAALFAGWACFCSSQEEPLAEPRRHELLKKGLELIGQAVAIDPGRGIAYYLRGHVYFWSQRNGHTDLSAAESLDRAAESFGHAGRLDSWNRIAFVWNLHARARAAVHKPDDVAVPQLRGVLGQFSPPPPGLDKDGYTRFIEAWTCWQLARRLPRDARESAALFERAQTTLERHVRENTNPGLLPEFLETLALLALDHARSRPQAAPEILESAARLAAEASPAVLPAAADRALAELCGEWGAARPGPDAANFCLRHASRALEADPNDWRSLAWRGVARLWRGGKPEARADLEKAVASDQALAARFAAWLAEARAK